MMRRVLMLTTFYPPYSFGGDAVDVQLWAGAFARRGCEVTVVHDRDAYLALASAPQPRHVPEPGVEVITLSSPAGRVGLLLAHQSGRPLVHGAALTRLCAERRFDTVIFANVSLLGGPSVFSLCPEAVRIAVATDHWLICPTHVLWRYDGVACDERRCLRCTLAHGRPPQLWRYAGLLDRAARNIDLFIARSEFSRRKHEEYGFAPRMEVVPLFVPPPPPARGESLHDRPYFLFVGRVEELKGLADVLPLFMTDRGADFVIAGTGTAEAKLRESTRASPHIRWLGFVPRHELGAWYGHAIALIVPSRTYETFGIIVIEAFSHGTPVIVRRRGPLPELLERGGGGLVFDTAPELDSALCSLLDRPALRQSLSDEALRSFHTHWSEEAVVPALLALVERARARRAAGTQHYRGAAEKPS